MDNNFEFTICAENEFYELIEKEDFENKDAGYIYECLKNKVSSINFSDHLKRYIYRTVYGDKSGYNLNYREYITDMFQTNGVPSSMHSSSTKLSAAASNWLSQKYVSRDTIFLLGFGLAMTVAEISSMLVSAAGDSDFDFKNPYEVIYWFCYRNQICFNDMKKIVAEYESMDKSNRTPEDFSDFAGRTTKLKGMALKITDKDELMKFLSEYGKFSMENRTVYAVFSELYTKTEKIVEILGKKATPIEVERQLYIGIPRTEQGNLPPISKSGLNGVFESKRLNRKRIADIQKHNMLPDRFDIITLNFFIHANKEIVLGSERNVKQDYYNFVDDTNALLKQCYMSELYATNPYENFIAMCMMTNDPMMTFAEVWSLSYEDNI